MTVTRLPPPAWRVMWWNFDGHHDFVGRRRLPRNGAVKPLRVRPPKRQIRDFRAREGAETFAAELRCRVPKDELVVQIVNLSKPPVPAAPLDQFLPLPDGWPLQRRYEWRRRP